MYFCYKIMSSALIGCCFCMYVRLRLIGSASLFQLCWLGNRRSVVVKDGGQDNHCRVDTCADPRPTLLLLIHTFTDCFCGARFVLILRLFVEAPKYYLTKCSNPVKLSEAFSKLAAKVAKVSGSHKLYFFLYSDVSKLNTMGDLIRVCFTRVLNYIIKRLASKT